MEKQRIYFGVGPFVWLFFHGLFLWVLAFGFYHQVIKAFNLMGAISVSALLIGIGWSAFLTIRSLFRRVSLDEGILQVYDFGFQPKLHPLESLLQIDPMSRPVKIQFNDETLKVYFYGKNGQKFLWSLIDKTILSAKRKLSANSSNHFQVIGRFVVEFDENELRIPSKKLKIPFKELQECKVQNGELSMVLNSVGTNMKIRPFSTLLDLAAFELLGDKLVGPRKTTGAYKASAGGTCCTVVALDPPKKPRSRSDTTQPKLRSLR